jgi:hypothetical protein
MGHRVGFEGHGIRRLDAAGHLALGEGAGKIASRHTDDNHDRRVAARAITP